MLVSRRQYLIGTAVALTGALAACSSQVSGQTEKTSSGLTRLDVPTLDSPSLGYFLGPIIKDRGFDKNNGLDITFMPEPSSTYRTNFASGATQVGASGTLLTDTALLKEKGGQVQYLFNVFDFWGAAVATKSSGVQVLTDFVGKSFGADVSTAQYAMLKALAARKGLNVDDLEVQALRSTALAPTLGTGRIDGVEIWEPAYTSIMGAGGAAKYTTVDLAELWTEVTGQQRIPYLGLTAHTEWVQTHQAEIQSLYNTYTKAAEFVQKNPADVAKIVAAATKLKANDVRTLIESTRLRLNVYWATSETDAVNAVFDAAVASGYLDATPRDVIYQNGQ